MTVGPVRSTMISKKKASANISKTWGLISMTLSQGCRINDILGLIFWGKHEETSPAPHATAGDIKLSMREAWLFQMEASHLEGLT